MAQLQLPPGKSAAGLLPPHTAVLSISEAWYTPHAGLLWWVPLFLHLQY